MKEPKEIVISGKTFIMTKFTFSAGREIVTQYIASGLPKMGDYKRNEELMYKLMAFVAIKIPNVEQPIFLSTPQLVDNHIDDWESGLQLEMEMMRYNCSFFRDGRASNFFDGIVQRVEAWITRTLTQWQPPLSPTEKQPSTN